MKIIESIILLHLLILFYFIFRNPNTPTNVRQWFDINWQKYGTEKNYLEITPDMTQNSVKTRLAARGVEFWNNVIPKLQNIPCQNTQD